MSPRIDGAQSRVRKNADGGCLTVAMGVPRSALVRLRKDPQARVPRWFHR
jgi:hypothetical protein